MKKLLSTFTRSALGMLAIACAFAFSSFAFSSSAHADAAKCNAAKQEFKILYLELQAKFLNYEGKDTVLDSKGNITLVPHKAGTPYEGKVFEEAIFKEYQNSLRKVGKLFQAAKFGSGRDELTQSSPGLVEFLKAIESEDPSEYIISKNINDVVDELYSTSQKKFAGGADAQFALNENDKYLLKKVLTHAQDRICSVAAFERTGKRTHFFDTDYLKQMRNAPLNRILKLFKDADISEDSEILVNDQVAIQSAMAEHIRKLENWMKKNEACRKYISNPAFIQANIQGCNYNRFLDSLSDKNFSELESVLHFINANEKFLNLPQAKAETDLNELYLESIIDKAFDGMGKKINCSVVEGENNQRKIFVRNLPYNNGKFDTSSIECKQGGKALSENECSKKFQLVSDELGRGLEIKKQNAAEKNLTFSIKGNPACENLTPGGEPRLNENKKTPEQCIEEGNAKNPKEKLIPSEDGKSCVPDKKGNGDNDGLKTGEQCLKEGESLTPPEKLIPSKDGKSCVPETKDDGLKTGEMCKKEGEAKNPKEDLVPSTDGKSCVPKDGGMKTPEMCKKEGEAKDPKEDLVPSTDGKSCVPKDGGLKTPEMCKLEGEAKDPKEDLVPSTDNKSCVPRTKEDGLEACQAKNTKWVEEENDGRPGLKWDWNGKECVDKRPAKREERKPKEDVAPARPSLPANNNPPARFTPVQIPTRQMYVLPGMP